MPYKLTGTLIALLFYGFLFNFSLFSPPCPAHAQLFELSEIQNGIFFLSHKNMNITAETFLTDKYIDEDQARYFSELSIPEINTPADENYPFTLVDHYILDSDLEIQYHYDCILGPYPPNAYLSRHNISIADYTNQKSPPVFFITKIKAKEPFKNNKVVAVSWILNNYEINKSEIIHNYDFQNGPHKAMDHCAIDGYVIDTTVQIISGNIAVWMHDDTPYCLQSPPSTIPCIDCLPDSLYTQPKYAQVKWEVPFWQPITPISPPHISCKSQKQIPRLCPPCLTCK